MQYLAHVVFGINFTQLGKLTARDRTSVANGCRRIEDMRDDPVADKAPFFSELALSEMDNQMHRQHIQSQQIQDQARSIFKGAGFDAG